MEEKKLVYILNQYTSKSAQHFYHVIHLLEVMADKGIKIVLIIEKADTEPVISHNNIKVVVQKENGGLKRALELYGLLKVAIRHGYDKIFIRISMNSALIASLCTNFHGGQVYYWQSGTTLEFDRAQSGIKKIKWVLGVYIKLMIIKNFVYRFVTGPESMKEYYEKELGIDPGKILVLYNDIDIDRFSVGTDDDRMWLRNELNIPRDSIIILTVHRLSPVRKVGNWIPQIMEDEKYREMGALLLCVGGGPEEQDIVDAINKSEYKDRFIMLGERPNQDIEKYYKGCDLFINPSDAEGFPRVVIEAMASGLPIVETDIGGSKDIVPVEQLDYVIDRKDVNAFKRAILALCDDKELRNELAIKNRDFVKRFSTERVADMYINRLFDGKAI